MTQLFGGLNNWDRVPESRAAFCREPEGVSIFACTAVFVQPGMPALHHFQIEQRIAAPHKREQSAEAVPLRKIPLEFQINRIDPDKQRTEARRRFRAAGPAAFGSVYPQKTHRQILPMPNDADGVAVHDP